MSVGCPRTRECVRAQKCSPVISLVQTEDRGMCSFSDIMAEQLMPKQCAIIALETHRNEALCWTAHGVGFPLQVGTASSATWSHSILWPAGVRALQADGLRRACILHRQPRVPDGHRRPAATGREGRQTSSGSKLLRV